MSDQIKTIPAARWDIYQTAAWIETHDLAEVGRAYQRVPARSTINEIELAWRAGAVEPSGEVDGAPRRPLNAEDASDFSIDIYTHDGEEFHGQRMFRHLHPVFPNLYEPGELLPEGECHVVIQSRRVYPEELVHDLIGAVVHAPGSMQALRHRFILGLTFDRKQVMDRWPAKNEAIETVARLNSGITKQSARTKRGAKSKRDFEPYRAAMKETIDMKWLDKSKAPPHGLMEEMTHLLASLWFKKERGNKAETYAQKDVDAARRWVKRNFFQG